MTDNTELLAATLPALIRVARAAESFWQTPLDYAESRNLEQALQHLRDLGGDMTEPYLAAFVGLFLAGVVLFVLNRWK
jgi:hypothetical protein